MTEEAEKMKEKLKEEGLKITRCIQTESGIECEVENKTVRIKDDASTLFTRQFHREFGKRALMPKTYRDFREILRELHGRELEIDKIYSDRIVLNYPKEYAKERSAKEGVNVTSIDLERYLIEP